LGCPPGMQDAQDIAVADDLRLVRAQDQALRLGSAEIRLLKRANARSLLFPKLRQPRDGLRERLGEANLSVAGVLPCNRDLAAKRQIVAHKHSASRTESDRQRLVGGVAHPDAEPDSLGNHRPQVEDAEEAVVVAGQRKGAALDRESGQLQGTLDALDDLEMT